MIRRCGAPLGVLVGLVVVFALSLCRAAANGDRYMGEWSR